MEFWGQEVKPGSKVSCEAGEGYVIHLSQAALGETKKGSENVVVSVKMDDKKLVLGTLSVDNHPQISCDLVFEKDFELSHSSKTASVFLCGYKSPMPEMQIFESDSGEDEISSDEELEADEIPMKNDEIKKHAAQVPVEGKKDKQVVDEETSSGDDDFSDDSDSEMSEDDSSDGTSSGADLSDDSEDETEDSEEQTPTPKPEVVGKKRAIEAGTPSGKKAKIDQSGQKTGDKKGAHVSTPYPAKSGKTPATDKKSKEKSPKSGNHACKSCSKAFGSEKALESHKKSKHQA